MYRNKLSPLYLPDSQSVVVDLWVGSSEVLGSGSTQATMLNPTSAAAPTPLTVSRIWDRWISAERLAGAADPDAYDWDLTPLASGGSGTNTNFAYTQGYYYQTRKPLKVHSSIDLDTEPYHHTILLAASQSALNDNTATIASKLAHWSPLVTGVGELVAASTDMGLCEHYLTNYVNPAIKNLQTAGKNVYVGGLYVSISGDSLSGYATDDSNSWCANMAMLRRAIEVHLGFVGIPTMILGVAQVDNTSTGADAQDLVRVQQQLYVELNAGTTLYFDTRPYPTLDQLHFDGQAVIDIAADATAARYASNMGLAHITKAL